MREKILFVGLLLLLTTVFGQKAKAFKNGEWLRFKMSYSGFLKAGEAEFSLNEEKLNGKQVFHATAKGKTSSVVGWFFKVRDDYQSYFDIETGKPYLFKRKIDEGGYKKNKELTFSEVKKEVSVKDILKNKDTVIKGVGNVHDMISTFYYLRSYDTQNMKKGEEIEIDMFFDEKLYPFKLKFLGYEVLETKFGKIKTQKFTPLVQSGRVFKEKESVTFWITADDNKIPVKLKASLSVGSVRAELDAYKGLAHSLEVIFE